MKTKKTMQKLAPVFILLILLSSSTFAMIVGAVGYNHQGFDRGISYKPMVPLRKTTFVNYNPDSYLDDYAYLASVPTSVIHDQQSNQIYAHPLLYFDEEYDIGEDKERSMNSRQGIDYFMDDWMGYANGYLDQMTLINVDRSQLDSKWRAKNYSLINEDDPATIASSLALHDWSTADNAVIAVVDPLHEKPNNSSFSNTTSGTFSSNLGVKYENFEVPKTNEVYPDYNDFTVPEGYKMLKVRSWYPCFYFSIGIPGFEGIINMSIPAGDRDLQIYCKYDGDYMMAGLTNAWNAQGGMDEDKTSVYVYKSGDWSVALTDVPTKSMDNTWGVFDRFKGDDESKITTIEPQRHRSFLGFEFGRYGTFLDILRSIRQVMYQIDVEMYPGTMVPLDDLPPYGCRNANFQLDWDDDSLQLGFSVIGPSGEEILSTREPGVSSKCTFPDSEGAVALPIKSETDLTLERLGECNPGEHYSICIYSLNDVETTTEYTLSYSWEQNMTRQQGDELASATQGAVLGSVLNAPLLYATPQGIPQATKDALYTLGVNNIYLLDIGGYLHQEPQENLNNQFTVHSFTTYNDIYQYIREHTGRNDVIFSTVDPFTSWHVGELRPAKEYQGALSIGPAAYIAAHHGSPVLLIDNHPELSSALVYHNELWRRHPDGHSKLPTVSEMYLTGSRIYDFLKVLGYDKEGKESLLTLGGQYDIGLSWDRVFVGKAKPGRFFGSPVDLSVWTTKNIFYPQLIFENPGVSSPNGVTMINGSASTRRFPYRGKLGLKIVKPSQEETFKYPVLDTLICYDHKFNSRASKYWGFTYKCADGTIPGVTQSFNPIDEGVMLAVNGEPGAYFADMSGSEVQPFYIRKAGYEPVFSTNFEANMHNLNQGVVLWMINTHGGPYDGGLLMFWDVEGENPRGYPPIPLAGYNKETNPWRGYEWLLGSTDEPDTMTSEIHGILPALAGNPDPRGPRVFTTALDWALAYRPIREMIGRVASLPVLRHLTPDWLQDTQDYYDGVIITVFMGRFGTSWRTGPEMEDEIGNIHSCGVSSVACLPAGKYLHLMLMRHGSVFQIMDPWATSWYSDVWQNGVPRGIALGKTIGEIFEEGISKVGISYISEPPVWWWDLAENVCLYGDPDLRIWTPSDEYSEMNTWEPNDVEYLRYNPDKEFNINGHTPFGARNHPNARSQPTGMEALMFFAVIAVIIVVLGLFAVVALRKKE